MVNPPPPPPKLLRRARSQKPVPVVHTTTVAIARKRPHVQDPDDVVKDLVPFLENVEESGKCGRGKGSIFPAFELDSVHEYVVPEVTQLNDRELGQWLADPSVAPIGSRPTILSIFAVLNLGQKVSLDAIAQVADDVSYDPNGFSSLVLRINELSAVGMVFESGIMVVSGCQTDTSCNSACDMFVEIIKRAEGNSAISSCLGRTQTITASSNVGFKIRTEHLAKDSLMRPFTLNDPLSFTGVTIQLVKPRSKIMIFPNGTVILTGCRSQKDVDETFDIIYPHLKMYAV